MSDHDPYRYRPMPYAQQPYQGWPAPSGWPAPPAPPTPPTRSRSGGALIGLGVFVAAAVVLGGASLAVTGVGSTVAGSGTIDTVDPSTPGSGGSLPGNGSGASSGGSSGGSGGAQPGGRAGTASATQQIGVVTIVSTLGYQRAQSAGTGMVLSADGDVLTNNHVIRGATSVVVTVETTGKSYRGTVVGTAPASDIAVVKLQGASGLRTAEFADDSDGVRIGDAVTGVGNAGGTGTLTAATGKVTALGESITASDETGQSSERLTDLIEVDARIISGDSGGPLYDADGEIIGVNTAASSSNTSSSSRARAYAIPIENAMDLAGRIDAGVETTAIHIGYPAFLGITLDARTNRAQVKTLLDGDSPAADAGITPGSLITGVDGRTVTSADTLRAVLADQEPGDQVEVTWTDSSGQSRSATLTLVAGPAD